jgi:hypothetical protein
MSLRHSGAEGQRAGLMRFAVGSIQRALIILRPLLLLEIVIALLFALNARVQDITY